MNGNKFVMCRMRFSVYALLLSFSLISVGVQAAPDCNPQSLARRAVGGEILNQMLGGFNAIAGGLAGVNNGISPTPSSAFSDCIAPHLNPPPRPSEPPLGSGITSAPPGGWSFGDPHIVTFDGLGYDFQGAGDYAYIESDHLTLHARHFRLSSTAKVSRLKAIAFRFNETSVVINDPLDKSLINSEPDLLDVITINGVDTPIGLGGWIDLDDKGSYIQRFAHDTFIRLVGSARILLSHDGNKLRVVPDESLSNQVSGMMGNFDGDSSNDLATASGVYFTIDNTNLVYGDFLNGWIREGSESLFNSSFDPNTQGSIVPDEIQSLSSVDESFREAAKQRCLAAGARPGYALYSCTYDMTFDEDEQWLEDATQRTDNGFNPVPAAAFVESGVDVIRLNSDSVVSVNQPAPGAGIIASKFEVDQFSLSLPSDNDRILQATAGCSQIQSFSLLLQTEGLKSQEYALDCDSSIVLPTGELTLSVFSNTADTGNYEFRIVEPAKRDLGVIGLDTDITGDIANNEQLKATLPSQAGDRVFIASNQTEDCSQIWRLLDATGALLNSSLACVDIGLITIGENAPYTLEVQQTLSNSYSFKVIAVGVNSNIDVAEALNQRIELIVSTPGQQASATFMLAAGQRIYIDREGGVLSGRLVVSDPSLTEITRSLLNEEDLQFEVQEAGNHTLTLEPNGDFNGTVVVHLSEIADDITVGVALEQKFELTLTTPGQRASASFSVAAGDSFTIIENGAGIIPRLQPPGNEDGIAVFGQRTFTAEFTGNYQVVIGPSDGFTGTIEFELQ